MTESWLLWGLLFGSIGIGYIIYGRKQKVLVPFVAGLGMLIFPYFVSETLWLLGIGVVLVLSPFFIKI